MSFAFFYYFLSCKLHESEAQWTVSSTKCECVTIDFGVGFELPKMVEFVYLERESGR